MQNPAETCGHRVSEKNLPWAPCTHSTESFWGGADTAGPSAELVTSPSPAGLPLWIGAYMIKGRRTPLSPQKGRTAHTEQLQGCMHQAESLA